MQGYLLTGMPSVMPEDWMATAVTEVLETIDEERNRTRSGFNQDRPAQAPLDPRSQGDSRWQTRDPDMPATRVEADFGNIWRMLPALKDIPAEMLRSLPVSTVLQLNDALARETKNKKLMDADAKLQHNAKSLAAAPTKVAGGLDNRGSILHEARFLGGAGSSAQCTVSGLKPGKSWAQTEYQHWVIMTWTPLAAAEALPPVVGKNCTTRLAPTST